MKRYSDHDMLTTFRAADGLGAGDFEQALRRLLTRAYELSGGGHAELSAGTVSGFTLTVRAMGRDERTHADDFEQLAVRLLAKYDPAQPPESAFWPAVEGEAARQVEGYARVGQWRADVDALLAEQPDALQWFRDGSDFEQDSVVVVEPPDAGDKDRLVTIETDRGDHIVSLTQHTNDGDRLRGLWR